MNSRKQSSHQILVVEDDEDLAFLFQTILGQSGYEVLHAKNLQEALKYAATPDIALVISDLAVPGIDSSEGVVELFRRVFARPQTPVILVSGNADLAMIAKRDGADGFLKKPCALNDFIQIVDTHLRG